jgi:uncharacterized protein YegP (UPF0339 family)
MAVASRNKVIERFTALESLVGKVGDQFEFKQNRSGEWIWRVLAKNGRQIGGSTEGYETRARCLENAWRMLTRYAPAP